MTVLFRQTFLKRQEELCHNRASCPFSIYFIQVLYKIKLGTHSLSASLKNFVQSFVADVSIKRDFHACKQQDNDRMMLIPCKTTKKKLQRSPLLAYVIKLTRSEST